MIIEEKNNKINVELYRSDNLYVKEFFEAKAFDDKKEEMGYVTFSINGRNTWIWKIETYEKYQNLGVGQALLDVMEYYCVAKRGCNKIEGKFYPTNQYAKDFYKKNNYIFFDEGYREFLEKNLYYNDEWIKVRDRVESRLKTDFVLNDGPIPKNTTKEKILEK